MSVGKAALWMGGAVLSFAIMTVGGRELAAELDTFEIMAWRSLFGLVIVAALGWRAHGAALWRTQRVGLTAIRNIIHFAAQNLWFFGIATIPLAQLVALEFTNPIWVTLLAPLLLAEALTRRKLAAAALGFIGVLVIARPGVAPLDWGHGAGLGAAIGFALTNLLTRRLSFTDSTLQILFWMTLSQAAMGFLCAAPGGVAFPSLALSPWMLFVGVTGLSAHFCLTRGLSLAPASVIAPMEFLRLPLVAVAAALMYGEPITLALALGAGLIVLGNLLALRARKG